MKRWLWLLLLLAVGPASAQTQLHLYCSNANSLNPNVCTYPASTTTSQSGDGFSAAFGKVETNFDVLFGAIGQGGSPFIVTNPLTFGQFNNAVAESVVANSTLPAQIMGQTPSGLATISYPTNDAVAGFTLQNCAPPVTRNTPGIYTPTSFAPTIPFNAATIALFRVGMWVITQESGAFYRGQINGWDKSGGTFLTVTGWFKQGNGGAGQQPPNTDTATINPFTKCWSQNSVMTIPAGSIAGSYAGVASGGSFALDEKDANDVAGVGGGWGIDVNNLVSTNEQAAYLARGNWTIGYWCPNFNGTITACFNTQQTGGNAFQDTAVMTSGNYLRFLNFNVNFNGQTDIGGLTSATTSPLVFHSSGHAGGDANCTPSGGTGATDGTLTCTAAAFAFNPNVSINSSTNTAQFLTISDTFSGAGSTTHLLIRANNNSNGANLRLQGNGATTPSKTLRVTGGLFGITNDAYTATLLSLDDSGNLTTTGAGNFGGAAPGFFINNVSTPAGAGFQGANGNAGRAYVQNWSASDTARLNLSNSNSGTVGTHAALGPGQILGNIGFYGDSGTQMNMGAQIFAFAGGGLPFSSTNAGTGLDFYTTAVNSINPAIALTIDTDQSATFNQQIVIGSPTGGKKGTGTINVQNQVYVAGVPLYQTGSFTGTFTDGTNNTTGTVNYVIIGTVAVVTFPSTGHLTTSAGTSFTMTGLPAALQPATLSPLAPIANFAMENNGSQINSASVQVAVGSGTLTFLDVTGSAGWTAPGARGFLQTATTTWSLL